ncbi:MAG: DUF6285 domain-containing protein [Candidatus Promineifilaceae bacterium]|nr:DUF6285 domain-containing protein [Candidatus Promineifilaceae bacterium]
MQHFPDAVQLLEAVADHLTDQVLPTLQEPRLRFRTLVAANVLAVVARELTLAPAQAPEEWRRLAALLGDEGECPPGYEEQRAAIERMNRRLCGAIERGDFDEPAAWKQLLAHCRQTAQDKLAIANPSFLERLAREGEK